MSQTNLIRDIVTSLTFKPHSRKLFFEIAPDLFCNSIGQVIVAIGKAGTGLQVANAVSLHNGSLRYNVTAAAVQYLFDSAHAAETADKTIQ